MKVQNSKEFFILRKEAKILAIVKVEYDLVSFAVFFTPCFAESRAAALYFFCFVEEGGG